MKRRNSSSWKFLVFYGLLATCACPVHAQRRPEQIQFDRDVRPILSDRCFVCHGPDAQRREADLRLDTREGLFGHLYGSTYVIRPSSLEQSAVHERIMATDDDMRMPPVDSNLALTDREKQIICAWIEQGAQWDQHWAFRPIRRPVIPAVTDKSWPSNPIDHFVLARLQSESLRPNAPASRERLIRRLSFDLTGLPPTLQEIDAFVADDQPAACDRLVDRLLDSPRFGERMAVIWLDAARYADTYGYQADVYRAVWPYRDWVVRALNSNMPFDQFVTWQLAGDLLPDATQEQILATAFNRLHRQTNEGGSVEEEFRAEYVADRVNTFGTTMLGLTIECARCHDHKFDPISQQDYYQLAALFDNIDESGLYSHFTDAVPTPTLVLETPEQRAQCESLQQQIDTVQQRIAGLPAQRQDAFAHWFQAGSKQPEVPGLIGHFPLDEIENGKVANIVDAEKAGTVTDAPQQVAGKVGGALRLSGENNIRLPTGGDFTRNDPFSIGLWMQTPDEKERAVIFHRSRAWTDAGSRGYQLLIEQGSLSASLIHFWPGNALRIRTCDKLPVGRWVHVMMTYDGSSRASGLRLYMDGELAPSVVVRDKLYTNITGGGATTLDIGQRFRDRGFKNGLVDELQVFNRCITPIEVAQLRDGQSLAALLRRPLDELDRPQREQLFQYFLHNYDPEFAKWRDELLRLRRQRSKIRDPIMQIMVMQELPQPRPTYVLKRGAYDAPGQQVEPGTPDCLPPWPAREPKNRLGLARWLTDPANPLLARVAVNRFWQAIMGRGLVATAEDFGSQGAAPTHPELLDWLASEFVDSSWDVKRLVKLIVTSSTYRQDSGCGAELRERDPTNRLLARAPTYRLAAEMVRDNALLSGGLLIEKRGGPPVKPYQPDGLWKEKSGKTYKRDVGEGSHRRSLYTYWKRTSPPPAMMILDAAKRDVCVARRQVTVTPLQALVVWNDPQYVEAARGLAQRTMQGLRGESPSTWISVMFRRATSRRPDDKELVVLQRLFDQQCAHFRATPDSATALLAIGDEPRNEELDAAELAAMTAVAQALLSYDETLVKR